MSEPKTVTMVATQRQNYGTKNLRVGDEFEVTEAEALDMVAMNSATRKDTGERGRYQRRDMRATRG